jgi:hypothetical protein
VAEVDHDHAATAATAAAATEPAAEVTQSQEKPLFGGAFLFVKLELRFLIEIENQKSRILASCSFTTP